MSIHLLRLFGLGWAMAAPDVPVPIRVDFQAPPGCSTAEAFYTGVRARTDRVRRAQAGERALSLRVRLTRTGSTIHGELGAIADDGKTETRVVDGTSCDEVVEALSLTAALALDPEARFAPAPVDSGARGDAGTRAAEPPSTGAAQVRTPEARSRNPVGPPVPPASDDTDAEGGAFLALQDFRIALGVGLFGARVVDTESSFGAGLSARLEQRGDAFLSPSFGLALLHLRNDVFGAPDRMSVRWTSFALSACPVRLAVESDLALSACALGLAGWLNAEGENLSQPSSVVRAWWSAGALARGSAALGSSLALELEVGLTVPLVRRRYVTAIPDEFVARTPGIAPLAGLWLVYRP